LLSEYLHSLPDQPDAIPYVTSYYKRQWGFCIAHSEREKLVDGDYKVVVETKLFNGELNYGEIILKGSSEKEIFMSTYICHPSMANNELSGPTVTTFIVKWLMEIKNRYYTYRIIFIPETIGAIVYLKKNYKTLKKNVIAGFNVTCVGDERSYSYLASRNGDTLSDKVAKHILKFIDNTFKSYGWLERGSDERQYCSPGIDLPVVSIMRTKYFEYPEYHTSLDNLENVVTPKGLDGGYWALRKSLEAIEKNKKYVSNNLCEPQLGKRGLYPDLSTKETRHKVERILNLLSLCDGKHSLLDIAEILNVKIWDLYEHIDVLLKYHLISEVDE
jgi:aminopeptidase-like protein